MTSDGDSLGGHRRFSLHRQTDHTGLSGLGFVADGVQWDDGTVTLRWRGDHVSVAHWDSLDDMLEIHGHQGATVPKWID